MSPVHHPNKEDIEMRDEIYEVLHKYDNGEYGKINIFVEIYDYGEDGKMLVIEDWETIRAMEKILCKYLKDDEDFNKRSEDEYDTSALDYMTNGGDEWTFSDEGFVCDECYKWKFYHERNACSYANYKAGDGYIICDDCICSCKENKEEYIKDLLDNPRNANTILETKDIYELGFEKVNDYAFANGMYHGENDDPKKILAKAKELYPDYEFLFSVVKDYNPFHTEFDLYKREVA